jgi:hypothetical protein
MLSAQKPSETVPAESVPDALTPNEALLLQEEASQATNSKLNKTQTQRPKQEELLQQQQNKKKQKQQRKPGISGVKQGSSLHRLGVKANPLLL